MNSSWATFVNGIKLLFRYLGVLILGNLLWIACCIPLVTIPPATMGLFYLAHRICGDIHSSESTSYKDFFVGFKEYFWIGYKLSITNLIVFGILISVFLFYLRQESGVLSIISLPSLIVLIFWALVQLYLFPIIFEQEDKSIKTTFRNSMVLVLKNFGYSIGLFLLLLIAFVISAIFAGPVLLISFTFISITQTLAVKNVIALMAAEQ